MLANNNNESLFDLTEYRCGNRRSMFYL